MAGGGASNLPGRIVAKRQRVVGTRRIYNQWVNNQTLEDYALRYTARKARRWSPAWVANTALGSVAFLACEAIGATVTVAYGRSEEHTSELQSLMRISYAVFCLKKKKYKERLNGTE